MTLSPRRCLGAFLLLSFFALITTARAADQTALVQLVEYVGADYVNAVADGRVINDAEYAEMEEFSRLLREGVGTLEDVDGKQQLVAQSQKLEAAVEKKAPQARIKDLAQQIRGTLVSVYGLPVIPSSAPNQKKAAELYQTHCAACHGEQGRGDGPAGASLDPPPTDFHDRSRYMGRSMLGLYTTITGGVDGTSMAAYQESLSDTERWALAFYVGAQAVDDQEASDGEQALVDNPEVKAAMTLDKVIGKAPEDVDDQLGAPAVSAMGYLRRNPQALFSQNRFIEISHAKLGEAAQAYSEGDSAAARAAALSAYLDGFEMIEQQLATVDSELLRASERRFMAVRQAIEQDQPSSVVDDKVAAARDYLARAEDALGGDGLSKAATFSASFFILFREGLEALLIVAALLTFTRKAGARSATRHIHYGWVLALIAGVATWFAASTVITLSGASRELTEGIAGVVAAAILFYVGFWMHSNSNSQKWMGYIKSKVDNALGAGTVWTLALVAFISVYREMFETILFYQALWTQVTAVTQPYLLYGLVTALAALAVVCVLIFRLGMRLPLGLFFKATSLVLLVLAVILLGKGVAALQEAGWLGTDYLAGLPTVDWLGFFPTAQGALAQLAAVVLAVFAWWRGKRAT